MMLRRDKLDKKTILNALSGVMNPDTGRDVVSSGMIASVGLIDKGEVIVTITVDPARGAALEPLRQQAEQAVAGLRGVKKVSAILTAERTAPEPPAMPVMGAGRTGRTSSVADPHGMEKNPKLELPIKSIIVVSSGKGGVGKSTIAANLAYSLAKNSQLKVGLLDADIYGPSVPKLLGLEGFKPESTDEQKIIPAHVRVSGEEGGKDVQDFKVMSIGFMVDAGKALIWRGPMVQSALYQLFRDVEWGTKEAPLDILIVDMPPGTGDAQLTLAQKVPVTGAIIVSTPQDIALIDARKGIEMFQTTHVPILGVIENMSTHICTNCGHEEHIFGHGGARKEAEKLGVPFLGEVPLSLDIRQSGDAGQPGGLPEAIVDEVLSALRGQK